MGAPRHRERPRFEAYSVDGRHTFQGKYGEFAMLRSRLDPGALALLQNVPDLPRSQEAMKRKYRWETASPKAKEYTNADKIQVMCHAGQGRKNLRRDGLDARAPAPQAWGAFARAFLRVNAAAVDALAELIQRHLSGLPPEVLSNENAKILLSTPPKEWLFKFIMIQVMRPGMRRDKRHADGGASLIHLGLSVCGTRALEFWEKGRETPHRAVQRGGDVYISSPALFEHQVAHEDGHDGGDPLLQFEDMGPCKVALQLRCNIFSHNYARSPPAGPTAVRQAVGRAVLAWFENATLVLPTCRDIEECFLASHSAAPPAAVSASSSAPNGSPR